ncbi:STAS domain-containing protein [Candidatus Nitronereus thalassa]|uniref:STAS domain-containing protein n=1 Tax=Candidatus Nitronereus thalassa TaxID=3020898 RepID=A0ABU3K4F8_9BACT|nr:STAS domain-containing protein [Candidatus Nitronereus thalassa]MDT7041275.1 STAS domain-containing protein [Candidatus Nitronereus thalassa]
MKFSLLVQNDVLVIRLYGLFNQRTTQKILKLLKQVRIHSFSKVTFDLTHVSSIDGSGLGVLFLVAHQLKKFGGATYALNPAPPVLEQMRRADLPSMLQIFPDSSQSRSAA